jgi:tRNA splicing ligase
LTAYVKENGFLGMVSYNNKTDDFIICSKSTPEGPFAELLKNHFNQRVKAVESLKKYLKNEDCTLVFECVDPEKDPHIIKYDHAELYLLDIVKNDLEYKKKPYAEVVKIANEYGFVPKTKAYVFVDWPEFRDWYNMVTVDEDWLYEGKHIEGFVIEDSTGYMLKLKLPYYSFWKHMRSVAEEVFRTGNYRRTGSLVTPMANHFFGFCKRIREEEHPTNIIQLREMFLKEYEHE